MSPMQPMPVAPQPGSAAGMLGAMPPRQAMPVNPMDIQRQIAAAQAGGKPPQALDPRMQAYQRQMDMFQRRMGPLEQQMQQYTQRFAPNQQQMQQMQQYQQAFMQSPEFQAIQKYQQGLTPFNPGNPAQFQMPSQDQMAEMQRLNDAVQKSAAFGQMQQYQQQLDQQRQQAMAADPRFQQLQSRLQNYGNQMSKLQQRMNPNMGTMVPPQMQQFAQPQMAMPSQPQMQQAGQQYMQNLGMFGQQAPMQSPMGMQQTQQAPSMGAMGGGLGSLPGANMMMPQQPPAPNPTQQGNQSVAQQGSAAQGMTQQGAGKLF